MDPVTAFVFSTLLMLANGAVLGFMHRDLPEALQPSARAWRVGTLTMAGGCLMLGLQLQLPTWLALPVGNGLLMGGLTLYWRALQRFDGRPGHWAIWVPTPTVMVGVYWFSEVQPSLPVRVVLSAVGWIIALIGSALTLRKGRALDHALSRRVMAGLFGALSVVMLVRALYFVFGAGREQTVVDAGSWVNALTPMLAAGVPVIGTTAFLLMCSERLRRQWELAASTDALTGLWNRRTLTERGTAGLHQAKVSASSLAVAILDVDHFKSVNDRYGHEVGDLALQHVAQTVRAACRANDVPGRHGGEEFVVLFDEMDSDQAMAAAERLREALQAKPFVRGELSLPITVSIGVAATSPADLAFDHLLRRADRALYRAKNEGRNRVVLADKD